jgi:hypothetical protein
MSKSKPYAVTNRGIDGSSTKRFASLKAAAKHVKDFYLGSEYIRPDGLQDETGFLTFKGFGWKDLGRYGSPDEYGYREFDFWVEFGGKADRDLDPTAEGEYSVCSVHPSWHPSYDYCTGVSYKTIARAKTASEARAKLDKLYAAEGDGLDGLDFNPFAVFRRLPNGRNEQVYLPLGDEGNKLDAIDNPVEPVAVANWPDSEIPF